MRIEGSWQDLETRGFVVARNFLSADELRAQCRAFEQAPQAKTRRYFALSAGPEALEVIDEKLNSILPQIRSEAKVNANSIRKGVYFLTEKSSFGWHIDFSSYYILQSHRDYITVWIPLIKPDPNKSGLSLIPMDALSKRTPKIFQEIVGGGAAYFKDDHVEFEKDGEFRKLASAVHPDEMGVSPELRPGDAVIFRNDLFHRTQDADTERVALAVRVWNSEATVEKKVLFCMSDDKYDRMLKERFNFACVLAAFWRWRSDRLTLTQLGDFTENWRTSKVDSLIMGAAYVLFPMVLRSYRRRSSEERSRSAPAT